MKRVIVGCICVVLFVPFMLWMVFSTPAIARWRNATLAVYEEAPIEQVQLGESFWNFEQIEQTDTLYDTLSFIGAIYNLSTATDEEATRSMVFAGEKKSYRIQLPERTTSWVTQFEAVDPMPKRYTGFRIDFSTLGMDDGEYKLLLQIEENDIPVARADTGYVVDKVNGYAKLVFRPSVQVEEPQNPVGLLEFGVIDTTKLMPDGTLNIEGYGNVNGDVDASEVEMIIGISSGYDDKLRFYSTVKKGAFYAANAVGDSNYYMSGFLASAPNVTEENLKIYVYARYRGEIYQCAYHLEPNGEGWFNLISDMIPDVNGQ